MVEVGVHAATDVTGFGLLGHVHEMAEASGVDVTLTLDTVPLFARVLGHAEADVTPGRTADLIAWAGDFSRWDVRADSDVWMRILCDPQTSGGLLMAVAPDRAEALEAALAVRGTLAARIGECAGEGTGIVTVSGSGESAGWASNLLATAALGHAYNPQ
jgi:selenide,water dikinase